MYRSENTQTSNNLSENQQASVDYIKRNNIQNLFSEMLNNVIVSQSNEPIVHMIKYLANIVGSKELEKEGIKIEDCEKIEFTPLIREFRFPSKTSVFLKKFISDDIYNKLKCEKTLLGGQISHMIQAGLKVDGKETVGIFSTDGEAYSKFSQIFEPAINFLQDYDKNFCLYDIPDHTGIFPILKDLCDKLVSIRFKYSRNLKGYPYNPFLKNHTMKIIKEKILNTVKSFEKGTFYEINNEKLPDIEKKFFDHEVNLHTSYGLQKENSGIYLSEDEKVAYLINYNDHLQIVIYDDTCSYADSYQRLQKTHNNIKQQLEFDYNDKYGYLTSCPSNVGMGLKITTCLKIPNVVIRGDFLKCCKIWSLRFKKNFDSSDGDNEIISKHKHGVSEISFINSYVTKICSLINLENNICNNSNYIERQLDVNKMKENLKSLYLTFYEKYKFIVTPHFKSFNNLFKLENNKSTYSVNIPDAESYFIFKDFVFDYITAFANTNMTSLLVPENRENLKNLYTENINDEILNSFDNNISKAGDKLKQITLVFQRNIHESNFTEVLKKNEREKIYLKFISLSEEMKKAFGGIVIQHNEIHALCPSNFKIFFEDYQNVINDDCKINFNFFSI